MGDLLKLRTKGKRKDNENEAKDKIGEEMKNQKRNKGAFIRGESRIRATFSTTTTTTIGIGALDRRKRVLDTEEARGSVGNRVKGEFEEKRKRKEKSEDEKISAFWGFVTAEDGPNPVSFCYLLAQVLLMILMNF